MHGVEGDYWACQILVNFAPSYGIIISALVSSWKETLTETTIIKNGVVITLNERNQIYQDGSVLIEDNRIVDVGPSDNISRGKRVDNTIDARGKAVLPGFVNLHAHSGLIRGTAEDLPLWEWLERHVDPKHKVLRAKDAYAASSLCYTEMIKAGITTVLDMYRFMHRCADAAEEVGIRAVLAPYVADKPEYDYFEKQNDNIELIRKRHGSANGRIHVWMGLEHLVYCSEEAYHRAREYADKFNVGIHTHGEESKEMAAKLEKEYGLSPIEVLHKRRILTPKTVLAHCVWVTPREIELLAKAGTSVAHCPVSNMKLASGVAPILDYLRQGVNVGLGTDGVKENNRLDMIQEMKIAGLLQKVTHLDAAALPANTLLRMATINGAKALGLGEEIGSLERGKRADIIILNLTSPHMSPALTGEFFNIISNIVYAAIPSDVETVLVDGKIVMQKRKVLTVDEEEVVARHKAAAEELLERRKPFVPKE